MVQLTQNGPTEQSLQKQKNKQIKLTFDHSAVNPQGLSVCHRIIIPDWQLIKHVAIAARTLVHWLEKCRPLKTEQPWTFIREMNDLFIVGAKALCT